MNKLYIAAVLIIVPGAIFSRPAFAKVVNPFAAAPAAPVDSHAFPSYDGDFSAMLMVIPESDLKEFGKPSDQGLHLNGLSKIKRGQKVVFKICFSGMSINEVSEANVTYDMKLLGPDGKISSRLNNKDMEGIVRTIPQKYRFQIFDNLQTPIAEFEKSDALGKYKIIADIHDNIGKKNIHLEYEFSLVE